MTVAGALEGFTLIATTSAGDDESRPGIRGMPVPGQGAHALGEHGAHRRLEMRRSRIARG